jgi:hypothetical protein
MFVPSRDLKRTAELSGRLADEAGHLIDLAERLQDKAAADELLRSVQALLEISRELNLTVDSATAANTSGPVRSIGLGTLLDNRLVRAATPRHGENKLAGR